jgi:hypothetical protein
MAVLPHGTIVLEAGIEHSAVPDEDSLQGRLLIRRIDSIRLDPSTSAADLLHLARALAADQGDLPHVSTITIEHLSAGMVRNDVGPRREVAELPAEEPPAQRHRTMSGPVEEAEKMAAALGRFAAEGLWMEALHTAQALIHLTLRFPEHEQRGHLIGLRRILTRDLLEEFLAFGMRVTEEQPRIAEVLKHGGPEAIELMVDQVRRSESVGPRKFIHDILAATPAALPLLVPLLSSSHWHEVRHGAELLGRLGIPDAIAPLRGTLDHPDPRVRISVIEALGQFQQNSVVEPIRRALTDPEPRARSSAAHALAGRKSAGLAMPILVALETEKDPAAWAGLITALVRIGSTEAINGLITIALDRRPLLKTGRPISQRLAVVQAFSESTESASRRALERLAAESDGQVRRAAAALLNERPTGSSTS